MVQRWPVMVAVVALLPFSLGLPAQAAAEIDPIVHAPIHVAQAATKGPVGYSPAQIRHAYGFDQLAADGSGQVIGIVDASDDPTVASDLQTFIGQFGLRALSGLPGSPTCTVAAGPHPCFEKLVAYGNPRVDPVWALEISLDVEWAHAIAPGADILLVESPHTTLSSMLRGVDTAVAGGARVVSMSWGTAEFTGETRDDPHFAVPGVVFVASSGDAGAGVMYPAASPRVLGVGGTTLPLDATGNLLAPETAWIGSSGGISAVEAEPGYQSAYPIPPTSGRRGVPDVSYDANPVTGVAVFDSTGAAGWVPVGGTSLGAPQWSALVALADAGRRSPLSSAVLTDSPFYRAALASAYRDITAGANGPCGTLCTAGPGYDFVTGLGSPLAGLLVPALQAQ
ncbi:MAG TPA: S53 family peptidase [Candidatus Limnocylindria bacterium]|nr:S53 family peptidase [Candidatus Limnocylindria bacterium]